MNIGERVVRKEFRHPDAANRVSQLVGIYRVLQYKQVPNVDTLHNHTEPTAPYPHVYLSPVGLAVNPASGREVMDAVVCVLQALQVRYGLRTRHSYLTSLQVMHSDPNPVYHRDIREFNIIKKFDGKGWFLIDWSDASTAPTRAAKHLKTYEHSPAVQEDNHGAEVDIWGVARYLENLASRVTCRVANPSLVQQMTQRWIADPTTTAAAALDEINVSITSYS